jgi:hypothetical protein
MLATAALVVSASAWSGQFADGLAARERGDFAAAFNAFKPLAQSGDANSQFQLSLLYFAGQGVKADSKQALYWLRQAATRGNTQAQSNLGTAFNMGRGVPQDAIKAYAWLNMASASGDSIASTNRDVVARKMTSQQLNQARALAQVCQQGNFVPCL